MKKVFITLAALLIFSVNTAAYAHTLTGQIVRSNDYVHYELESNGQTYELKFDRPVDLKPRQKVEVKGDLVADNTIIAKDAIVLAKLVEKNGVLQTSS